MTLLLLFVNIKIPFSIIKIGAIIENRRIQNVK